MIRLDFRWGTFTCDCDACGRECNLFFDDRRRTRRMLGEIGWTFTEGDRATCPECKGVRR